jgi:hypothetical protein
MFVLKLQKLLQTKNKEVRETGLLSCIILKTKLFANLQLFCVVSKNLVLYILWNRLISVEEH